MPPKKSVASSEAVTKVKPRSSGKSVEEAAKSKSCASRSRASARSPTKKSKIIKGDAPDAESNAPVDEDLLKLMGRALTHNQWYHGLMPRDEIEDLIKKDGDFLVRKTEVNKQVRYAVSVMSKQRIRHILLNYKDGKWWLREAKKDTLTELIEYHVNDKFPVQSDGTLLVSAVPRPDFYILHEHIEVKKRLGGGAFGEVFTGVWKKNNEESVDVAVKKLKGMMRKKQRAEFVKEAKLMKRFDHPNIVRVFGVAPQEEPVMIVLELAAGGSLQSHLKNHADVSKDQLLNYCKDAARGMCYLSGRQVIHRDIAARNCLLGKNDELKISDFGLSVADTSLVKLDKLRSMPVKWLAPETLGKGEFSKKSDVWSYGVLVWEIFSRCKSDPFPGETNVEAKKKILSGSIPLQAPEGTPQMAVAVMQLCFTQSPDERPDFEAVFKLLAPKETPPAAMDVWDTYAT
ncbi:hypothetical protein QR680_014313 [Steinernema hermaphroditum]|uniref:Tyrosine-protein kinase n=1 Tax=Steinernema hermaphroditum TaxID=289476 RepID=A0AA39IB31_9BILA|nr:hypothetical protein QR680_014313 [Steinernema hermaphroditum]